MDSKTLNRRSGLEEVAIKIMRSRMQEILEKCKEISEKCGVDNRVVAEIDESRIDITAMLLAMLYTAQSQRNGKGAKFPILSAFEFEQPIDISIGSNYLLFNQPDFTSSDPEKPEPSSNKLGMYGIDHSRIECVNITESTLARMIMRYECRKILTELKLTLRKSQITSMNELDKLSAVSENTPIDQTAILQARFYMNFCKTKLEDILRISTSYKNQDLLRLYEYLCAILGTTCYYNYDTTWLTKFGDYDVFKKKVDTATIEYHNQQNGKPFTGEKCFLEEAFAIKYADKKYGHIERKKIFSMVPISTKMSLSEQWRGTSDKSKKDILDELRNTSSDCLDENESDAITDEMAKRYLERYGKYGIEYNADGTIKRVINLELLLKLENKTRGADHNDSARDF